MHIILSIVRLCYSAGTSRLCNALSYSVWSDGIQQIIDVNDGRVLEPEWAVDSVGSGSLSR